MADKLKSWIMKALSLTFIFGHLFSCQSSGDKSVTEQVISEGAPGGEKGKEGVSLPKADKKYPEGPAGSCMRVIHTFRIDMEKRRLPIFWGQDKTHFYLLGKGTKGSEGESHLIISPVDNPYWNEENLPAGVEMMVCEESGIIYRVFRL